MNKYHEPPSRETEYGLQAGEGENYSLRIKFPIIGNFTHLCIWVYWMLIKRSQGAYTPTSI